MLTAIFQAAWVGWKPLIAEAADGFRGRGVWAAVLPFVWGQGSCQGMKFKNIYAV